MTMAHRARRHRPGRNAITRWWSDLVGAYEQEAEERNAVDGADDQPLLDPAVQPPDQDGTATTATSASREPQPHVDGNTQGTESLTHGPGDQIRLSLVAPPASFNAQKAAELLEAIWSLR